MQVLKSKFLWLNVIAILIMVIQYFISNQILVKYLPYEGLAVVILNAIAGMITSQKNVALKAKLTKLNIK